jgi:hypothetical protein
LLLSYIGLFNSVGTGPSFISGRGQIGIEDGSNQCY